jgi:hypothetical protein
MYLLHQFPHQHSPYKDWTRQPCLKHLTQQYQNDSHYQLVRLVLENYCLSKPFGRCICLNLILINFTQSHPDNIFLNKESSITNFNHKQEDQNSQDENSIQTPKNDAKHKCGQQI